MEITDSTLLQIKNEIERIKIEANTILEKAEHILNKIENEIRNNNIH